MGSIGIDGMWPSLRLKTKAHVLWLVEGRVSLHDESLGCEKTEIVHFEGLFWRTLPYPHALGLSDERHLHMIHNLLPSHIQTHRPSLQGE